ELLDHVAADAAAGAVVDDDVAARADALVDVAVDVRVAGGLVVGAARVDGHDARARLPAAQHVVGDLLRLRRQVRGHRLVGHASGRGDGQDHFAFGHGCSPSSSSGWDVPIEPTRAVYVNFDITARVCCARTLALFVQVFTYWTALV